MSFPNNVKILAESFRHCYLTSKIGSSKSLTKLSPKNYLKKLFTFSF